MKTELSDNARPRGYYWVVFPNKPGSNTGEWTVAQDTGLGQFPWRICGDERVFATADFLVIGERVERTQPASEARLTNELPEKSRLIQPKMVLDPKAFGMVPRNVCQREPQTKGLTSVLVP